MAAVPFWLLWVLSCVASAMAQTGKNIDGVQTAAELGLAGSGVSGGRLRKNQSHAGSRAGYLDLALNALTAIDPDVRSPDVPFFAGWSQ